MALLAETKEWRGMAAEMAAGFGLHYIPVQEALVQRVGARGRRGDLLLNQWPGPVSGCRSVARL